MLNFFKDLIIEVLNYFKYRIVKLRLYEEIIRVEHVKTMVEKMRSPDLPPELLKNCKVFPDRIQVLSALPKGGVIAEVGVALGDYSRILIDVLKPEKFYAFDNFIIGAENENREDLKVRIKGLRERVKGAHALFLEELLDSGKSHPEYYQSRFYSEIKSGVLEICKGLSWDMLKEFPDEYFDYIYVDADHKYESVMKDIEQVKQKMKKRGIIQFNDYCTFFPSEGLALSGVQRAVNEFMLEENYEMLYLCMESMGYYDVVVRRKLD
jgi:hypothetical protein